MEAIHPVFYQIYLTFFKMKMILKMANPSILVDNYSGIQTCSWSEILVTSV